jgi:predicted 3-demethylubiquinone-9 3-methyltransferase (glyoxalase superfamily)
MTTGKIVPCLWLDAQAEEAAKFYTTTFPEGRITAVSHYPESSDNPSNKPRGSVLTVEFDVGGTRFTALNGGPLFKINPSISFFVSVERPEEADRIFAALADRGEVLMAIGKYPWSERFGWVKDRFGVSWQVMAARAPGRITIYPCLMFTDLQKGRADEAIETYTSVFPDSRVEDVQRYTNEEGPEGMVKHGRFILAGQLMVVMDSKHIKHGFGFNEAVSLQVMCKDQSEVDRFWEKLSEGGEKGPCGWLKDRFGLSWQIVPAGIVAWMTSKDVAARDRAFGAMMRMKKPDIAALQAAFEGHA